MNRYLYYIIILFLLPFVAFADYHDAKVTSDEYTGNFEYVILKRGTSFSEQVKKPNTIYEIRYNYDLNGINITLPPNCILKFEGGVLRNGTLTGNNTRIEAGRVRIFNTSITLAGEWYIDEAYPEWTGAEKNNPSINTTKALEQLEPLDAIVRFTKGNYYLSEYYIEREGVRIYGDADGQTSSVRFLPYSSGQRYIIKIGGGKDTFGQGTPVVRKPCVKHIWFSNFENGATKIGSGNPNAPYECGLFCVDAVQIGQFDVYFSGVYGCPAVYLGFSYEITFDNLICYSSHSKSDCPMIVIGNKRTDISCAKINKLALESLTGTAIKYLDGAAATTELVVDDFFFEGTMDWDGGVAVTDVDDHYFKENREALNIRSEYEAITKVPIFDLNGYAYLSISNAFINNLGNGKWKNRLDADNKYKSFCFAKIQNTAKSGNFRIQNVQLNHVPFFYIEDSFVAGYNDGAFEVVIDNFCGGSGVENTGDHNNNDYADSKEMFNLNTYFKHVYVGKGRGAAMVDVKNSSYVTILPYVIIQDNVKYTYKDIGAFIGYAISNNNGGLRSSRVYCIDKSDDYFKNLPEELKKAIPEKLLFFRETNGKNRMPDHPLFASNILSDKNYHISITGYRTNQSRMYMEVRYFSVKSGVENSALRVRKALSGSDTGLMTFDVDVMKREGYSFNLYQVWQEYNSVDKYLSSMAIGYVNINSFN